MIGGVCGGLGEYLDIDSTVVRILFVVLALMGGPGFLVYLILLIIVPSEDTLTARSHKVVDATSEAAEVDVEVLED
jgi:phage shock protein PspC (stress-responsive transcriptional regulator)